MYVDIEREINVTKGSQQVRLIADLFIIAPFLIYMSTKKVVSKTDKMIFIAIAASTIWYNTRNYLELKHKNK